jgi:hypothetical protein
MRRIIIVLGIVFVSLVAHAQHSLQLDSAGRYGIIKANPLWPITPPNPPTEFTMPPTGGTLIVVPPPGVPALVWLTAGNTLAGGSSSTPDDSLGSVNNFDVIMVANNIEKMRLVAGGGVSIPGAALSINNLNYTWPGVHGAGTRILSNDGTGNLSWTNAFVTSITGTANQVLANGTSGVPQTGAVTLTTPQDIATTSSPTFNNLTLDGNLDMTGGNINNVVNLANGAGDVTVNDNLIVTGTSDLRGNIFNSTGSVVINDPLVNLLGNTTNPLDAASTGTGPGGFIWVTPGGLGYSGIFANNNNAVGNNGLLVKTANTGATTRVFTASSGNLTIPSSSDDKFIVFGNGVVQMPSYTTNGVIHATGANGTLTSSLIVNADVDPAAAIAYSKLAAMPTGNFLFGNAGVPTSGAMSGDATVSATGVIDISNNAVENSEIRQSAGLSVIGRSANTLGDVADITAGAADHVLRVNTAGNALGFGTLAPGAFTPGANNTFLTTNGVGVVGWTGFNRNATLVGDGITTALGLDLTNPNTWTGTGVQTFSGTGNGIIVTTNADFQGSIANSTGSNGGAVGFVDNIVPTVSLANSLGTDALRWSEAYIGGTSVHIGPSGGEAGNTEMNLGYSAGTGSIDINGGADEVTMTTALMTVNTPLTVAGAGNDLTVADDANIGGDVILTGAGSTIFNSNAVPVDIADLQGLAITAGPLDAQDQGNLIGDGANAEQLQIDGVNGGAVEVDVNGDMDVSGALTAGSLGLSGDLDMNANDIVDLDDLTFSQGGSQISNTGGDVEVNDDFTINGGFTIDFNMGLGVVHSSAAGVLSSSLIVNADVDPAAAIAYSKLAAMPTGNFLIGNGGTPTSTTMSGDATVNATGVIDISNNAVENSELRQGIARSVIGVTGNATANVADIQGTTDQVLRVDGAGTTLAFGQVATGGIADDAVTNAKIRNSAGLSVIGRSTNSAGDPADIVAATANHVLRLDGAGTTLGFGTLGVGSFTPGANNTFLTTNGVGVVGWTGFSRNATLVGDGITTALGLDLANANTWTAIQTFGDVVVNADIDMTSGQITNVATIDNAGGIIDVNADLVPLANLTYDLGSDLFRWADVYVGGASVHIGSALATEMTLGYAAGVGSLNVNGGANELTLSTGSVAIPSLAAGGIVRATAVTGALTTSGLVDLTSEVTGVLPIANGGTNSNTALSGSSIMVSNGTQIVQGATGTANQVLHGNLTWGGVAPADMNAGAANTFLTTNGGGTVGWTGLNIDGLTITGNGVSTAVTLNTANANTWTATQSLPSSLGQGNNLIGAINAGTTGTINANMIANGLTDAQVVNGLTIDGGTINNTPIGAVTASTGRFTTIEGTTLPSGSASTDIVVSSGGALQTRTTGSLAGVIAVSTNGTLTGNGTTGTPLGINLGNANTWAATQTLPATGGQGDALITSINAGTTTINDARITDALTISGGTINNTPIGAGTASTGRFTTIEGTTLPSGSASTSIVTSNGGVLETRTTGSLAGTIAVSTNGTLTGNGTTGTPLGINLGNANTWTSTQTFQNVLPSADNTYDLGSDAARWQDLYVNGASMHIGPSGGQAGNTELAIGYAANIGSINVDGGAAEVTVTTGTTTINTAALALPNTGTAGVGKVLTSDGSGNATWQNPAQTVIYGESSPAAYGANQNDLALVADGVTLYRISSSANISITGIVAATSGRLITLVNVGANNITLEDDDAGSAAANQFHMAGAGADIIMAPDAVVTLVYDGTSGFWRVVSTN